MDRSLMGRLKLLLYLIPLVILSLPLGCGNTLYVMKLGWHQASMACHSVAVQGVLEDPSADCSAKEKIRFIQEVKRYGEERLGLKRTKNYTTYLEVKGPILYAITACEKDRFNLRTWSFPIAGEVTYKGFFTEGDAEEERHSLEGENLDTFVQPVYAYSTLGWLRDPIFSSMLAQSHAALTNLILHEMTHATIYFKGRTDFNEQVATFVGNRGAIAFLSGKCGPDSEEVREAIAMQEDDLLFSRWIDQACEQLSSLYARDLPREKKLRKREKIFQSLQEDFEKIAARFKTGCYRNLGKVELNNATLMAYRQYVHGLERFEALYEDCGRDLRKVVECFKEMRRSGQEPAGFQ
jgi:predicted aminopeptidase